MVRTLKSVTSGVRFGQFLSVGATGAVVDNVALAGFVELGGIDPLTAKVLAAEISIILMFAINESWTFSDFGRNDPTAVLRRFLRSNVVRVGGVAVALGVLAALHDGFGVWYLAANIVGIGVGFVVNYFAESVFTWRVQA